MADEITFELKTAAPIAIELVPAVTTMTLELGVPGPQGVAGAAVQIVNSLTSEDATKALAAPQGQVLSEAIGTSGTDFAAYFDALVV